MTGTSPTSRSISGTEIEPEKLRLPARGTRWLDELFGDVAYIDAFREVNADPDHYTWWSNRGQAWSKNVGWRIDYQVLSPRLKGSVVGADIHKTSRFSDHAPLTIEYDLKP